MTDRRQLAHAIGGPAAFLLLALAPVAEPPYEVRASLGLLVWMSWWWVAEPVHLAVTAFLPVVALALFDFLPVATILPAYSEPLVMLLIGASILAALWQRTGLDRRIALVSLLGIGPGTRQQIVAWFAIAAGLSAVLPNAVVAATMMPIVVALLRFIGIADVGRSAFGSALLLAVAWGTSIGGAGTPLGGAHNLLAVQFLERLAGREYLFTTWLWRVLPLMLLMAAVAAAFMRRAFRLESERLDGSRAFFANELRALGPMSGFERWGLALFATAALLAFTRQLYASLVPALAPAFVFLAFGLLAFVIRHRGEPLLEWRYAESHIVWGLIYLFAGGSALGQVLNDTGAATYVAGRLIPLADGGGLLAVAVFSLLAAVVTQITSNTAAVAIVVPIAISAFQGLGLNPVPFVYIVTAVANCGLMLPSSSAGPAIAAGYGVDLKTMFRVGAGLLALIWVLLAAAGYLAARFWSGFGVA